MIKNQKCPNTESVAYHNIKFLKNEYIIIHGAGVAQFGTYSIHPSLVYKKKPLRKMTCLKKIKIEDSMKYFGIPLPFVHMISTNFFIIIYYTRHAQHAIDAFIMNGKCSTQIMS